MSFEDFVRQAAVKAMQDTESEIVEHPIDRRAQAMELRDRYRRAIQPAKLEPGMLCREKMGVGILKRRPLVMFWRWLDPDNANDRAVVKEVLTVRAAADLDCLIGILDVDGDLTLLPGESWRLEPCEADYPED